MTAVDEAVRAHIGTETGLVVVQPGTLCNLDCAYCYLPARKTRNIMSVETARALAASLASLPAPVTGAIRKDRHMAEITEPAPTEEILARLAGDVGREPWHQETFKDFGDGRRNSMSGR